jgi:hypothetical protein
VRIIPKRLFDPVDKSTLSEETEPEARAFGRTGFKHSVDTGRPGVAGELSNSVGSEQMLREGKDRAYVKACYIG